MIDQEREREKERERERKRAALRSAVPAPPRSE